MKKLVKIIERRNESKIKKNSLLILPDKNSLRGRKQSQDIPTSMITLKTVDLNSDTSFESVQIFHQSYTLRYEGVKLQKDIINTKLLLQCDRKISNTLIEPVLVDLNEELDQYKEVDKVLDYFLPSKNEGDREYTLVLDMDETLIHFPDYSVEDNDQG